MNFMYLHCERVTNVLQHRTTVTDELIFKIVLAIVKHSKHGLSSPPSFGWTRGFSAFPARKCNNCWCFWAGKFSTRNAFVMRAKASNIGKCFKTKIIDFKEIPLFFLFLNEMWRSVLLHFFPMRFTYAFYRDFLSIIECNHCRVAECEECMQMEWLTTTVVALIKINIIASYTENVRMWNLWLNKLCDNEISAEDI